MLPRVSVVAQSRHALNVRFICPLTQYLPPAVSRTCLRQLSTLSSSLFTHHLPSVSTGKLQLRIQCFQKHLCPHVNRPEYFTIAAHYEHPPHQPSALRAARANRCGQFYTAMVSLCNGLHMQTLTGRYAARSWAQLVTVEPDAISARHRTHGFLAQPPPTLSTARELTLGCPSPVYL